MEDPYIFLAGEKPAGRLLKTLDWSGTALPDPALWPEVLKSAIGISLNSLLPIAIYWGPEFTLLYNDAYAAIPGARHPWAAGKPAAIAWADVWSILKDQFRQVTLTGQPLWLKDTLLLLTRNGYIEECYFDYTLSPIPDHDGKVAGLFNAVVETSCRVLDERRTQVLQSLMRARAESLADAILLADDLLRKAKADLPGYMLYLSLKDEPDTYRMVSSSGLGPEELTEIPWPALKKGDLKSVFIADISGHLKEPFISHFPEPCSEALCVPVSNEASPLQGYMVALLSARKRCDPDYQHFIEKTGWQLGNLLNSGYRHQKEFFYNDRLVSSEPRFQSLVNKAPVAITLLVSRELIIESANDFMLKLLARPVSVIGQPLAQAVPELGTQNFLSLLDEVYVSGNSYNGTEVRAVLDNAGTQQEGYFNFIFQPLHDPDKNTYAIMVIATDVTDQVKAKLKQQRAEEMLRFSIEAANIGTWSIDAGTRSFHPSWRVKEFFGFEPDEEMSFEKAVGQIAEDQREQVLSAIEDTILNDHPFNIEFSVTGFHDGKLRWLKGLGKLSRGAGHPSCFTGVLIEITEQKMDELRKSDFISMVSHEMKTPLTSLKGYIQLLNMRHKEDKGSLSLHLLEKADIKIDSMTSMINRFLNVSRLEAGKIELNNGYFDLNQLINEVSEELLLMGHSTSIFFEGSEALSVYGDREKIGTVISNLLSNAIKYSDKGKPVTVSRQLIGKMVRVSVRDEGIGIRNSDQDKLFNRYYRVYNKGHETISGFGIGLYLSAEIIRRHYGEIWVESEPSRGSTFHFSLPVN